MTERARIGVLEEMCASADGRRVLVQLQLAVSAPTWRAARVHLRAARRLMDVWMASEHVRERESALHARR